MTTPPADFNAALIAAVPRIRQFCYALTGSVNEADDLLQSTLEKALHKWHRFEPGSQIERWLFRICRNHWIDNLRNIRHRGEQVTIDDYEPTTAHGETVATANLTLAKVQTGMLTLSENLREVLYLVGVEGLSYQEVAELLGIPIGTVMSRLARARGQLIENLGL